MDNRIRNRNKINEEKKIVKKPHKPMKRNDYGHGDLDWEELGNDNYKYEESDFSSDNEESDNVPDHKDDNKQNSKEKTNISKIILICIISVLIIVGLFLLWENFYPSSTVPRYSQGFIKLIDAFPAQTEISWKILNNTLAKQLLREQPIEKPSVIILVGQSDRVDHFIKTLIKLVIGTCPMYKQTIQSDNADALKSDLSDFLGNLVGNGARCAYLPEIDNIPPSLGSLLHALSDELNALYKEMIYIFSLKISLGNNKLESPPKTDKDAEKFVKNQLSIRWEHEQGTERFVALHTRLLVNVVNVL